MSQSTNTIAHAMAHVGSWATDASASRAEHKIDNARGIVLKSHPDAVKVAGKDVIEASSQYMKYMCETLLTSNSPLYRFLPSTIWKRVRDHMEVKRFGGG